MVSNTRWGRQVIYQRRLVWNSDGQELWSNKGEWKVNGRPIDSQTDYVHTMGLINREMASRRGRPLLGEPFGLEVFWQNLLDHLTHNKCLSRLFGTLNCNWKTLYDDEHLYLYWSISIVIKLNYLKLNNLTKPLGKLKPNCPGMIIGWSSTKCVFLCRSEIQYGHHRRT